MSSPMTAQDLRVTTRVIADEVDWDAIRPDWDLLHRASPEASPFLRFAWLRGWWRTYGPAYGRGGLRILTHWRGPDLIGAVPLYVGLEGGRFPVRCLRFLSTGEAEQEETCPDYLDLLCRPGYESACAGAAWDEIVRLTWDRLELLDLPGHSPLFRPPVRCGRARTFPRGACPVADLTGGFESYLGRLKPNSRQQARRLLREGERAGVRFELVTGKDVTTVFDEMVRLHQERWTADQKPGAFASGRFTDFHRALIREWVPGAEIVLARLSLGETPIAVLYGFVSHQRFAFYQSGVTRSSDGPLRSPGNLAHLLLMGTLADSGVLVYDFLRGTASYKERLATGENRLTGIRAWRPTLRGAASWPVRVAGRIVTRSRGSGVEARP